MCIGSLLWRILKNKEERIKIQEERRKKQEGRIKKQAGRVKKTEIKMEELSRCLRPLTNNIQSKAIKPHHISFCAKP